MRRALQLSLNVPAIELLEGVGPARLVARMKRAGATPVLPDLSPPGLAVGLGGVGVTLTDLVAIHAAIARGGMSVPLAIDADRPLNLAPPAKVLDERAAWYVASILAGAPGPDHVSPGSIAFKTGTSYGYRDAWAIGFDGRHVIGVWVGRPDNAPVPGLIGIDAAAPILMDAFARMGADDAAPCRTAGHRRGDGCEPAAAAEALPLAERAGRRCSASRPRSPIRRRGFGWTSAFATAIRCRLF